MLGLDVPNDRLDRGAAAHLAADRGGDAAHLAADPDAELISRRIGAVTRRTWPLIQTRNFWAWLWPR
jgi:hypothetical protein